MTKEEVIQNINLLAENRDNVQHIVDKLIDWVNNEHRRAPSIVAFLLRKQAAIQLDKHEMMRNLDYFDIAGNSDSALLSAIEFAEKCKQSANFIEKCSFG